jgi:NNP family nitrate/nitrite transporter-like MFS transporter
MAYAVIAALVVYQYVKLWQVNKHLYTGEHPPAPAYKFKQVAIINFTYLACFGSELAVVSMLPLFFINTFHISPVYAGLTAGSFAIMNLFARPGGGWLSDRIGRRKVLSLTLAAQTVGYLLLSQVDSSWSVMVAIGLTIVTSIFVQAACGGVDSVMPLIQRRMTGQIAGLTGAYGNVGGVVFLTVLSLVSPTIFFMVIAAVSALAVLVVSMLDEPKGHMVEVDNDGNVKMIAID